MERWRSYQENCKNHKTSKKVNSQRYQHQTTLHLTQICTCNNHSFHRTDVDNPGHLIVKSIYSSDSSIIQKVWAALCIYASSKRLLLHLGPPKYSSGFIKISTIFVIRRLDTRNIISYEFSNFVLFKSQEVIFDYVSIGSQMCFLFVYLCRCLKDQFILELGVQRSYFGRLKYCQLQYYLLQKVFLKNESILNSRSSLFLSWTFGGLPIPLQFVIQKVIDFF